MSITADRLFFDVLCIIFEHYAQISDSPSRPLETLLLVCKSWSNGARSYSKLWSTFNIVLMTSFDAIYWTSCIPRRLKKCPPDTLVDIRIDSEYTIAWDRDHVIYLEALKSQLVGNNGELARRWRRLVIRGGNFSPRLLAQYLKFPTPNLEEFECYKLQGFFTILPHTPSLKIFNVSWLQVPKYPDLSNVTHIRIGVTGAVDENALALAVNVVDMHIRNWLPFKLAATYPHLRKLELEGQIAEDCLKDMHAPQLEELTLRVNQGCHYLHIISCKGIDFAALLTVRLRWLPGPSLHAEAIADYAYGVRRFLTSVTNLQTLVFENDDIAYLALKLLTDECRSLYQSHTLKVELGRHIMELGHGDERMPSVNRFRELTNSVPDCSWNELYKLLDNTGTDSSEADE